jgi:hypothetical protein
MCEVPPILNVGDRVLVTYAEKISLEPNQLTFGRREKVELWGVIIERPPDGAAIFDNDFEGSTMNFTLDEEIHESLEDLPGSGSVWFFPDRIRKHFVRLDRNGAIDLHHEDGIRYR